MKKFIYAIAIAFLFIGHSAFSATLYQSSDPIGNNTSQNAANVFMDPGFRIDGIVRSLEAAVGWFDGYSTSATSIQISLFRETVPSSGTFDIDMDCDSDAITIAGANGIDATSGLGSIIPETFTFYFTGTECELQTGVRYVFDSSTSRNDFVFIGTNPSSGNGWGIVTDVGGVQEDFSTRFISITPENATTTATSTQSVGFTAYINEDDWYPGSYFEYRLYSNSNFSLACVICAFPGLAGTDKIRTEIPVGSSGEFTYSTTTSFEQLGDYNVNIVYKKSRGSFLGFSLGEDEIIDSNTYFTVVQKTFLDIAHSDFVDNLNTLLASTTATLGDACSPLSSQFSLPNCLAFVVVPSSDAWDDMVVVLRGEPPWGYAFRFYDIITGQATTSTTTVPLLAGTIPNGIPGAGTSFSFDLTDIGWIFDATSTMTTGSYEGKTLWEIVHPYWLTLLLLGLGLAILHDIIGFGKSSKRKQL